jgi:tripartite-type tricarboxylate transporter receptor subunit TctC
MGGHVVCLGVGLALLTSLNGPCFAQDYPTRPIHLIVPFAAGGGADAVARVVAQRISGPLGQQVVVGTEFVAKAKPDGYTLLLGQSGPISSILSLQHCLMMP